MHSINLNPGFNMLRPFLLLLASLVFSCAHADEADVRKILQENYPQIGEIEQVNKANILGLYEVVVDGQLFYTDEKAQYLIIGNIVDLKSGHSLTEARARVLFAVDFNSLPLELAVKRVKGNGKRKMAYFADPNCGYCKRLENEMLNVDNVTLYRFLYPIFEGSDKMVRNILCSRDPSKTWEDWMVKGVRPVSATCESAARTDKVVALGKKMRVTGTPTLIFSSGLLVPGYVPADELEKNLDATTIEN
jgi:thiol:disulfide interchange protein DsbC